MGAVFSVPVAPDYAPSLAASGRRHPPQRATQKNSRRVFFGTPSGRTFGRRHLPHRTAPGYRACGYKTVSGRPKWLSRDPLAEIAGPNLYKYVNDNPENLIDPFGLVDLSYTPDNSPDNRTLIAWEKTQNPSGLITISGHGTKAEGLLGPDGQPISPDTLAKAIAGLKKYNPNTPIILIVCYSGAGKNSYAQQLANALNKLNGSRAVVGGPNVRFGPSDNHTGPPRLAADPYETDPKVNYFTPNN